MLLRVLDVDGTGCPWLIFAFLACLRLPLRIDLVKRDLPVFCSNIRIISATAHISVIRLIDRAFESLSPSRWSVVEAEFLVIGQDF